MKENEELNKMAEDRGLVLIENFQFRFHSQLQYIKNLVDNGSIGELRNMRVSLVSLHLQIKIILDIKKNWEEEHY